MYDTETGMMHASLHHGIDPALGQVMTFPPMTETPPPAGSWYEDYLAQAKGGWEDWWSKQGKQQVGWPAPVPVRPDHWIETPSPMLWKYELAYGDTLSGLAGTYLGSPQRWKDIWDVQPDEFRWNRDPGELMAGEILNMPDEARDNMLNWIKQGKPGHTKPGELPPETIAQKGRRYAPYVAGAAAVVGIGYLALR